ncbi:MAG: AbrB/MazE/SpoVT family DNA-binding domain-containing protein [Bacteroidetes bacterium]|jgi:antitoxin MazE|nr:AbrB/MazE/SpoVT family DNA-binding domain-containing protein [Bacteroidota bacterium]
MEIPVIKIGNSKGLRLGKALLERYQIKDKVELILEDDQIIIRAAPNSRQGWDKAFQKMRENHDDALLIPDVFEDEFPEEWA